MPDRRDTSDMTTRAAIQNAGLRISRPEIGVWVQQLSTAAFTGRPCFFLDRDGVVVEEVNYLHRVEDVVLIGDVAQAIAEINRTGNPVVMVTNQAGIGRGYYGWDAFAAVQERLLGALAQHNARIDMVLACAYHRDAIGPYAICDHPWRKPRAGMLLEAARILRVDLGRSFIIGDTVSDLLAGMEAGLVCGALALTGHGRREYRMHSAELDAWRDQGRFHAQVVDNAAVAIRDRLKKGNGPRCVAW